MNRVAAVVLAIVGLAIGILGVGVLREATLSTHDAIRPGSQVELLIEGDVNQNERTQTLAEMVEAQVLVCRLEVKSDLVGEIEERDDGSFRALLAPGLDETDRRQFRGCLEDWVIDGVRLDVIALNTLPS